MAPRHGLSGVALDRALSRWLRKQATRWRTTVAKAAHELLLADGEVQDREHRYRPIHDALRAGRFNEVRKLLPGCNALYGRFDAIRLSNFLRDRRSIRLSAALIQRFPRRDREAAKRIDAFVDRAVRLHYRTPEGGDDSAGAALLASVLLTSAYPDRFVDFRASRWTKWVTELGSMLPSGGTYGELLIQTGAFANAVCVTPTFRRHWSAGTPLWTLAGICWLGPEPERPAKLAPLVQQLGDADEAFPEGREKELLHRTHERNRTVVALAKQWAAQRDRWLPCDVCGFSFRRAYGDLGENFIEAHHRLHVATLKANNLTRVGDIALVCANCHRMLHTGQRTLTVDELGRRLSSPLKKRSRRAIDAAVQDG
jgi:hypothetical protein